jgi:DNA-binding SARP family transcriptional activator
MTGGKRYERILVHSLLGTIWLATASQQWPQAIALWKAYESLKAADKLPAFAEETDIFRLLQPYMEISPARSQGQVYTLTEATGLALEIIRGFESRVTITPAKYKLRVLGLGPTEVYLNGQMLVPSDWTFAKPKELLYYLISNSPKTKEQIGIVFWPDASPSQLRTSLRATLYHLRRALGERGWVLYEDGYYKFNRSMDHWYDLEAFEETIESAERLAGTPDEAAIEKLEEAVALYRGDFLSDLSNDEWGTLRREELRNKYMRAMSLLGEILLKRSAYDRAIELYRSLLSTDILMEEAHRALMRCYVQKGERALALRQYQTLVEILQDELGASPSSETTVLYQSIQQNSI